MAIQDCSKEKQNFVKMQMNTHLEGLLVHELVLTTKSQHLALQLSSVDTVIIDRPMDLQLDGK